MLSLPVQALALRRDYPDADISLSSTTLEWLGRLTPSELSETYEVKLVAGGQKIAPIVRVLSPKLEPDPAGRLPHVWPDGSLCLFRQSQWSPRYLFAETIIPWASEWLLHYEFWKGAGIWLGDGIQSEAPDMQASLLHQFRSSTQDKA